MNGLALAGGVLRGTGVAASARQPSSHAARLLLAWFKQSGAVTQHGSAACGKAVNAAAPSEAESNAQMGLSWWSPSWHLSLPPGRLVVRAALWLRTSARYENEPFTGPGFQLCSSKGEFE